MRTIMVRGLLLSFCCSCAFLAPSVYADYSDQIYSQGYTDLQPEPSPEDDMNQQLQEMQNNGQERGGRLQEYMDQTNNTMMRDQPDEREIQNDGQAAAELRRQHQNEYRSADPQQNVPINYKGSEQ